MLCSVAFRSCIVRSLPLYLDLNSGKKFLFFTSRWQPKLAAVVRHLVKDGSSQAF